VSGSAGTPRYVVASSRAWGWRVGARLAQGGLGDVIVLTQRDELTAQRLEPLAPALVFIPHWSWLIPAEVFERFECVLFHMTALPFGRGGSPLQNLIVRGLRETTLSAIRVVAALDAGPIYLQRPLSLAGSADEIFLRAEPIVQAMIEEIVRTRPVPVAQQGEPVVFVRRKPADGDVAGLGGLEAVYDHIRMLDGEGYPPAFVEAGGFRFEFTRAVRHDDRVEAAVRISRRAEAE
jgi:methionyl-tRNA formyltransferase